MLRYALTVKYTVVVYAMLTCVLVISSYADTDVYIKQIQAQWYVYLYTRSTMRPSQEDFVIILYSTYSNACEDIYLLNAAY